MDKKRLAIGLPEPAAGNGLLDRRGLFGAAATGSLAALISRPGVAAAGELAVEPWMQEPGSPFVGYGQPSWFEAKVVRVFTTAPGTTGTGASRTPHHLLNGAITPSGLHFERHHSGIPDIDPDAHRLLIHGLVKRPLVFTLEALARYPMASRIAFIECGGNSGALYQKDRAEAATEQERLLAAQLQRALNQRDKALGEKQAAASAFSPAARSLPEAAWRVWNESSPSSLIQRAIRAGEKR